MAASVLGKRTRSAADLEAVALPFPARKRRTRIITPPIYADNEASGSSHIRQNAVDQQDFEKVQAGKSSSRLPSLARNSRSKPISQLKSICSPTSETVENVGSIENIPGVIELSSDHLSSIDELADENAQPKQFTTPTTTRFKDALQSKVAITPRHRIRLTGTPLTPRTPRTYDTPANKTHSVYASARRLFSQSSTHGKVIGRISERQELKSRIMKAVESKSGGCTYISGPPGTGKSALVHEVFEDFRTVTSLKMAFVNCVSLKSAKELHNRLMQEFCPELLSSKKSQVQALSSLFTAPTCTSSTTYLVVLDEMDSLLASDCEVLCSMFEWSLHSSTRLYVIGIANALDLTDRFLPKLTVRKLKPHLLPFMPYNAKQISEIIIERLRSTLLADMTVSKDFVPFVHPAAVMLSSKKVASQNGDLRKAFNLVRGVIDQVERETLNKRAIVSPTKQPLAELANVEGRQALTPTKSSPMKSTHIEVVGSPQQPHYTAETAPRASIAHVARLSSSIFNNGTSSRLGTLNLQQKAILCSLVAKEKKRALLDPYMTPSKSTTKVPTVNDLFIKYAQLCKRDEGLLQQLKPTEFRDVVASLETLGLVHESGGRASSLLTPPQTPSRAGRNPDDKQIVSGVSETEMAGSLNGPGADLLMRLFNECF